MLAHSRDIRHIAQEVIPEIAHDNGGKGGKLVEMKFDVVAYSETPVWYLILIAGRKPGESSNGKE
jgi:hypothetical protein